MCKSGDSFVQALSLELADERRFARYKQESEEQCKLKVFHNTIFFANDTSINPIYNTFIIYL